MSYSIIKPYKILFFGGVSVGLLGQIALLVLICLSFGGIGEVFSQETIQNNADSIEALLAFVVVMLVITAVGVILSLQNLLNPPLSFPDLYRAKFVAPNCTINCLLVLFCIENSIFFANVWLGVIGIILIISAFLLLVFYCKICNRESTEFFTFENFIYII